MSAVGDLLPPGSAGEWEHAVAAGMSDELPVPYAVLMNPYQAPASFLPWLAAHHSVDLWYEDWPEEQKREMIAQYAGVSTRHPGESLPELKGTHEGALRFLSFVDAEVFDSVSYPARFVLGRSSPSFTPLNHPAFKARWLIKVLLKRPVNAFVLGRSALGLGALRPVDLTPIRRAKEALRVAKAPETEYLVSFAWRRQATFGDNIPFGEALPFGGFIQRNTL